MYLIAKKLLEEIHNLEIELMPYDIDTVKLIREKKLLYDQLTQKESFLAKFFIESYKKIIFEQKTVSG
jgi:hypothetical protein